MITSTAGLGESYHFSGKDNVGNRLLKRCHHYMNLDSKQKLCYWKMHLASEMGEKWKEKKESELLKDPMKIN